jgi:hypothetical protein
MNTTARLKLVGFVLVMVGMAGVALTSKPEAISTPTVYVGEVPNDQVLHVPLEFYVDGHDFNPDTDTLAPFDYINLTPEIATRIPAQQPHNGFSVKPKPGAVGLAQFKVLYGNSVATYEKVIEVSVVPAGSLTLEVDEPRYYPDLYEDPSDPY